MPQEDLDGLVEERVAQLHQITKRRNELLTEMFCMIRRRDNIGSILSLDTSDEEDEDLQSFLQKHDLNKHPDTGTIANLRETSIFAPPRTPQSLEGENEDKGDVLLASNKPDASDIAGRRSSSRHPSVDSEDELDLIERPSKSPAPVHPSRHASQSSEGSIIELDADGKSLSRTDKPLDAIRHSPASPSESSKGPANQSPIIVESSPETEDVEMREAQNVHSENPPLPPTVPPIPNLKDFKKEEEEEEEETAMSVDTQIQPPSVAAVITPHLPAVTSLSTPPATIEPPAPPPTVRPQDLHPVDTPIMRQEASRHVPTRTFLLRDFRFDDAAKSEGSSQSALHGPRHQYSPQYTLPPIKSLPIEFSRKSKPKTKKKDRESRKDKDKDKDKDEWTSLGLNRWGFTINANPVWKRVAKAAKCLTTRDWSVAMTELRLARTIDRIETLKDAGKWSFRQPKRQRNVDHISKTHWDYLMDEMKWMRIDFREERKWKIAVAYNLSTSVLEWHAAGSMEERIRQGICVLWRRPLDEDRSNDAAARDPAMMEVDESIPPVGEPDQEPQEERPSSSMLLLDYGSDDDDGDEQDRESVIDALEAANLIEESLDRMEDEQDPNPGRIELEPKKEMKVEEVDYSSSLANNDDMEVDNQNSQPVPAQSSQESAEPSGLKVGSSNPVLASKSTSSGDREATVPTTKAHKIHLYGPVRDRVVFSSIDKLFVDLDDFKVVNTNPTSLETIEVSLPPADLSDLFPDLQTLSLFDPPAIDPPPIESKKKGTKVDKDDFTRRLDELTYSKVFPVGKFMTTKPTLVSALQPAKRWRDDQWLPWEDPSVTPADTPSGRALDEASSELFGRSNTRENSTLPSQLATSRRDLIWTPKNDELLKSLIEKYGAMDREKGTNWRLIAECFNASRVTVSSDRRGPGDCLARWREKWGPADSHLREAPVTPSLFSSSVPSTPMSAPIMTRGVKRLASNSISGGPGPMLFIGQDMEPKNKRHKTVQDCMRKLIKRRTEMTAKNAARKTNNTHDTHTQYTKLQYKTPGDLVRLKMEKDAKDMKDARDFVAAKAQVAAAALASRKAAPPANGQAQAQAGASGQSVPSQAPPPAPAQAQGQPNQAQPKPVVPAQQALTTSIPIRNQVNISQQRIATPMLAANRGTPQQILRQQQQHAQVAQQAQAQMNQQAQSLPSHQALTPHQIQMAIAQLQAQTAAAQAAAVTQGANSVQVNGNGHASPTNGATTANVNSPRPASAQPRATNISGHYYMPNVGPYSQEQIQNALRYQALQQQHLHAAQQAQQQQQQQLQAAQNQQPPNPQAPQ